MFGCAPIAVLLFVIATPHFVCSLIDRPRIGILSQPISCSGAAAHMYPSWENYSYIDGAYAKWIEMGGGDPVGVPFDVPKNVLRQDYYEKLNGVIFPGGSCNCNTLESPMMQSAKHLYDWTVQESRPGKPSFVIWGTCQGLQILMILRSLDPKILDSGFNSSGVSLPLHFVKNNSRMFSWAPPEVVDYLKGPRTYNAHHLGMTVESWNKTARLTDFFDVVSTSTDLNGVEFISTIEAKNLPIYGAQWHSEFVIFEDSLGSCDRSFESILGNQLTANFFVNQARASPHRYLDLADYAKAAIENTRHTRSDFLFPDVVDMRLVYVFPQYGSEPVHKWLTVFRDVSLAVFGLMLAVGCIVLVVLAVWGVVVQTGQCRARKRGGFGAYDTLPVQTD